MQFKRLHTSIGDAFLDPNNGNWCLVLDGLEPYNKVTHSMYIIGLTCIDLPVDAYARGNNCRVIAIVPGPKAPNNLHACILPLLMALDKAAGGDPTSTDQAPAPPEPIIVTAATQDRTTIEIPHIPYLTTVMCDRMAGIQISGVLGPAARICCHYCVNEGRPFPNASGVRPTYRPAGYSHPVPQQLRFGGEAMLMNDPRLKLDHAR